MRTVKCRAYSGNISENIISKIEKILLKTSTVMVGVFFWKF